MYLQATLHWPNPESCYSARGIVTTWYFETECKILRINNYGILFVGLCKKSCLCGQSSNSKPTESQHSRCDCQDISGNVLNGYRNFLKWMEACNRSLAGHVNDIVFHVSWQDLILIMKKKCICVFYLT